MYIYIMQELTSSSSSRNEDAAATMAAANADSDGPLALPPSPANPLPGRVRTNSGTTCSAQAADYADDEDDDSTNMIADLKALAVDDASGSGNAASSSNAAALNDSTASPTCVAALSTVVDVQEGGGAEVTLVLSPDVNHSDDDEDEDGLSVATSYDSGEHDHRNLLTLDAPVTPRAAQIILQDCQSHGYHETDGEKVVPSPQKTAADNISSFLFCGVTDIVNCQKDDLTSSPMIRPVHFEQPTSKSVSVPDLNEQDDSSSGHNGASRLAFASLKPSLQDDDRLLLEGVPPPPSSSSQDSPSTPMGSKLGCGPRGGGSGPPCCKSNNNTNNNGSEDDLQLQQQTAIEATIGNFLSSPGDWCDGWQAWSIHMSAVCDGSSSSPPVAMDQVDLKTVLRNRAGDLNSRRRRIHRLRRDLSPFDIIQPGSGVTGRPGSTVAPSPVDGASGITTPPLVPGGFKKSRSFADASSALLPRADDADVASSVVSITSSVLDAMQNCDTDGTKQPSHRRPSDPMGMSNMTNRSGITSDDEQDDLCYDSDPGDAGGNCKHLRRRDLQASASPPTATTADAATTSVINNRSVDMFLRHGGTWSSSVDQNDDLASLDPTNDDDVTKAVDGILHRRMMLVWHQPEGPVAVYAWIELGSQLRSALIQPKLMWKPVHETEDERGALGITTHINLHSVDLLDISRVLAANRIDRTVHPLAKRSCSLSIETFDHNLLFETSCEKERDTLVQGLKGLVARLASKIIVGDEGVFDEYFTPFGSVVPGEAPEWAR